MDKLNAYLKRANDNLPIPLLSHPVRLFILTSVFSSLYIVPFWNPCCERLFFIQPDNHLQHCCCDANVIYFCFLFFFLDQIQTVLCMMKSKRNLMCVCVFLSVVAIATAGCCPGWRVWRSNKSQRRSPCCQSREDWTQTRSVQTLSLLSFVFLEMANRCEQKGTASNLFVHFDQSKMVALISLHKI